MCVLHVCVWASQTLTSSLLYMSLYACAMDCRCAFVRDASTLFSVASFVPAMHSSNSGNAAANDRVAASVAAEVKDPTNSDDDDDDDDDDDGSSSNTSMGNDAFAQFVADRYLRVHGNTTAKPSLSVSGSEQSASSQDGDTPLPSRSSTPPPIQ